MVQIAFFLLGDIFDSKSIKDIRAEQQFIDTFSIFPVPFYFISGNYDRTLYKNLNIHGSIHYFQSKIMKIESKITKQPIFFAHDFGNSYIIVNNRKSLYTTAHI